MNMMVSNSSIISTDYITKKRKVSDNVPLKTFSKTASKSKTPFNLYSPLTFYHNALHNNTVNNNGVAFDIKSLINYYCERNMLTIWT